MNSNLGTDVALVGVMSAFQCLFMSLQLVIVDTTAAPALYIVGQ